jgi:hypothetical protein
MPQKQTIEDIGEQIDQYTHRNKKELKTALNKLQNNYNEDETILSQKYYFIANIYSKLSKIDKQLYFLRKSTSSFDDSLSNEFKSCVYTNLAICLGGHGRLIEAREMYIKAIEVFPDNGVTYYMLAQTEKSLASFQKYDSFKGGYLNEAYKNFEVAEEKDLSFSEDEYSIKNYIKKNKAEIKKYLNFNVIEEFLNQDYSLGKTKSEREYRDWCLSNKLFLDPLNEITSNSIAARDGLNINGHMGENNIFGLINNLKREYITARYMFWEGVQKGDLYKHFSDNKIDLIDTYDYQLHYISSEKIKSSFRICYSILDKIAFFLNHYFELKIPEREVSAKKVANNQKYPENNLMIGAILSLIKDFFEGNFEDGGYDADAKMLYDIRNHIEHKYLKVVWIDRGVIDDLGDNYPSKTIKYDDLIDYNFKLFKKIRAAIFYIIFMIDQDNSLKREEEPHDSLRFVIPTHLLE